MGQGLFFVFSFIICFCFCGCLWLRRMLFPTGFLFPLFVSLSEARCRLGFRRRIEPAIYRTAVSFESAVEDARIFAAPLMLFRTAFAFAIVPAVSASLMALSGGMVGLSVYWFPIHFAVVPAVSYFKVSVLILFGLAVFVASVHVEFVDARRKLFRRAQQPDLKPAFLLFPSSVCNRRLFPGSRLARPPKEGIAPPLKPPGSRLWRRILELSIRVRRVSQRRGGSASFGGIVRRVILFVNG
jgi:hypothetical protein